MELDFFYSSFIKLCLLTCAQPSTLYWQIQNEDYALIDTTSYTFDTIVTGSQYIFTGYNQTPPIVATYKAAVFINDELVGGTILMYTDTTSASFLESIGPCYTK